MKRAALPLVLVVACATMGHVIALHGTPWLVADEMMYARAAWNLGHRGLVIPDVPGTMNYPPLYGAVLSLPSLLPSMRLTYRAYQTVNGLMWAAGGALGYAIARRTAAAGWAWLVVAATLACPSAATYVPLVMSENLSLLLIQGAAFCLFQATTGAGWKWLVGGWAVALAAPFCRVTGFVVPLAFLLGLAPARIVSSRAVRGAILAMAVASLVLLVVLPTSALKVYHPLFTASVVAKTLLRVEGWHALAQNLGATFAFLVVGSAGLVWLLFGGTPEERPIRRYLLTVLLGQAAMTVVYMQYGSAGPNAPTYRAVGRYLDPGIAAAVPWLLVLKLSRGWTLPSLTLLGALASVAFLPSGGFKPGQVLPYAGLGFESVRFPSLLRAIPPRVVAAAIGILGALACVPASRRWRFAPGVAALLVFAALSHDALAHVVALSHHRERAEPALWRLASVVPPDARVVVDDTTLTPETLTALYSGLFWIPWVDVGVVQGEPSPGGRPTVMMSRQWRPDRTIHAGSHAWYLVGESPPPVEESVGFYGFGHIGGTFLFGAPPMDGSRGRWTGESPSLELRSHPQEARLALGVITNESFVPCVLSASLNGTPIGRFVSTDSVASFPVPTALMRPDGRQILSLRVSPLADSPEGTPWIHGVRLDWVAMIPVDAREQRRG